MGGGGRESDKRTTRSQSDGRDEGEDEGRGEGTRSEARGMGPGRDSEEETGDAVYSIIVLSSSMAKTAATWRQRHN